MPTRHEAELTALSATSVDYLRAVGQQLREARQQRGEDLYDIAEILRLKPAYLYALEEGDYAIFPGRAYAFGFLRSYADYLGFQGEEVLRQIKAVIDAAPVEPRLEYRAPIIERHRPTAVALVTAALLVGAAWGGWYAMRQTDGRLLDRLVALPGELGRVVGEFATEERTETAVPVPVAAEGPAATPSGPAEEAKLPAAAGGAHLAVVERLAAPEGTPPVLPRGAIVPAVTVPNPEPAAEPSEPERAGIEENIDVASAIAAELPEERELLDAAPAAPSGAVRTAAAPASAAALLAELRGSEAAPEGGRIFGDPTQAAVMLLARETTWIQVRSIDRTFVRTRTLEPGDRFYLPARDDLALWTGNAGGLEIWLGDRRLGLAGAPREVVRDLPLRPAALETVAAGG